MTHRSEATRLVALLLCGSLTASFTVSLTGCAFVEEHPRTAKGAGIGTAAGAATGAAVGAVVGGGKGAAKGAAIGAVLGLLGGGLVGSYMDSQAKEMQGVLTEQDRLRREQETLQVSMASDTMFDSGKATLYPGGRQKLRQFADVLQRYPRTTVQVSGYTDSRGSEESNLDLSRRRAQAVAEELIADGVSPGRITTRGLGEADPVASNATPEGRAQNRRVEIVVNPDSGLRAEEQGGGGVPAGGGAPAGGGFEEPR